MITRLRSAVLCEAVEETAQGASYINVYPELLLAPRRPSAIAAHLALMIDLDGAATDGVMTLATECFKRSFPFVSPGGDYMLMISFPVLIPVVKVGAFTLTVADTDKLATGFAVSWRLDYVSGAESANNAAEVAEMLVVCNTHAEVVRETLTRRAAGLRTALLN